MLRKTLENSLDSKEIKGVNPKGNQPWIFIGRTDAEAETPVLWPPDVKGWLTGKDPAAGKDWRQEEKGTTEDKMIRWHHWLNGHEFEQALGDGEGWRSFVCYSLWGRKESDTTGWLNNKGGASGKEPANAGDVRHETQFNRKHKNKIKKEWKNNFKKSFDLFYEHKAWVAVFFTRGSSLQGLNLGLLHCRQSLLTPGTVAHQASLSWNSPGQKTGMDCHALLQGIEPRESKLRPRDLLHCRWVLYRWATRVSHWGVPHLKTHCKAFWGSQLVTEPSRSWRQQRMLTVGVRCWTDHAVPVPGKGSALEPRREKLLPLSASL